MTTISGGGDLVFGTDGGDLTFEQHRVTLLSPTVYYGDPQKIIDRLLASGADIADLPAPAVAVDNNDVVPVVVDGVLSAAEMDDLPFVLTTGDSTIAGKLTVDDGTGKVIIDQDGSGNTRLALWNEAVTQTYWSVAPFLGGGAVALGDGASTADVLFYRSAAGQVSFLLGRVVPRVTAVTGNSPTWNVQNCDQLVVTSITGTVNLGTNMTTGTLANGEIRRIALTGNGTHSITWPSLFEASNTYALPTALPGSGTRLDVTFIYNTATSKLRCIGVA